MHDFEGGFYIKIEDLIIQIKDATAKYNINGVSILGGEPLEQFEELLKLMKLIKELNLGIILYTGYEKEEIKSSGKTEIFDYADLLISGRYIE